MRIAFTYISNSSHMINRMKYFLDKGHDLYYLGLTHAGSQPLPDGIKYISIKSNQLLSKNPLFKPVHMFHKVQHFRKVTKELKFDIIHFLWLPYCVNALFAKSRKKVFEIGGSDVLLMPGENRMWRYWYRLFFKFADAVIQDSVLAQKAGIKYGAPVENNALIEIGIDFRIFNPEVKKGVARSKLGISDDTNFIFSPRCFHDYYNIDTIIRSIPMVVKIFPDTMYVFCEHSGDRHESLNRLINELNVRKNVILTGCLDNTKEMPFYYRDANAVVSVPSSDSSPHSVYEAMACKSPCIISDLRWYHDKLEKDKDLAVVPVRDPVSLAKKIISILDGSKILDTGSAYNKVYEFANQVKEGARLEQLYCKILSEAS